MLIIGVKRAEGGPFTPYDSSDKNVAKGAGRDHRLGTRGFGLCGSAIWIWVF